MQAPAGPVAGGRPVVVVVVAVVVAVVAAWSLSAVLGQEWSQTWRWVVVERVVVLGKVNSRRKRSIRGSG